LLVARCAWIKSLFYRFSFSVHDQQPITLCADPDITFLIGQKRYNPVRIANIFSVKREVKRLKIILRE